MGFLDFIGWRSRSGNAPLDVASWDAPANQMVQVVLSDIFGQDVQDQLPLSRAEALTVPAVEAATNLLIAAIASLDLVAVKDDQPLENQPLWLTRTDGQSPYLRDGRTVLDLFFNGYSLWRVTRGSDGFPLTSEHVPLSRWTWNNQGIILIDGKAVEDSSVIIFESLYAGLLNVGSRTLRQAIAIEKTIAGRADVAIPIVKLQQTDDQELEQDDIDNLLTQYAAARRSKTGMPVFVPKGLDLTLMEDKSSSYLLEARNAVTSDVAKLTGLPSAMLESTSSIDSQAYTTELGQRSRFQDFSLRLWLDPIQARLSQSDVTPNGTRVEFDTDALETTPTPTANPTPQGVARTPQQPALPTGQDTQQP